MTGALFSLALRQALTPRKAALLIVLGLLPLGLAALLRSTGQGGDVLTGPILEGVVMSIVLPLSTLVLATSAFGNEVEDRTLSLLVTKPVSRAMIVLAKLVATVVVAGPLMFATAALITMMHPDAGGSAWLAAGAGALVGVAAYATVFTWAGLLTTRALGFGLIYVLIWEGLLTGFLSNLRYFSMRSYAMGTMQGLDEAMFSSSEFAIELPWALGGAAAVTVVFFLLTARRLGRMDVG